MGASGRRLKNRLKKEKNTTVFFFSRRLLIEISCKIVKYHNCQSDTARDYVSSRRLSVSEWKWDSEVSITSWSSQEESLSSSWSTVVVSDSFSRSSLTTSSFFTPIASASSSVCGSALPLVSGRLSERQADKMAGMPSATMGRGFQRRDSSEIKDEVVPNILKIRRLPISRFAAGQWLLYWLATLPLMSMSPAPGSSGWSGRVLRWTARPWRRRGRQRIFPSDRWRGRASDSPWRCRPWPGRTTQHRRVQKTGSGADLVKALYRQSRIALDEDY